MSNKNNIQTLASIIRKNPNDIFSKFALALELRKQNQVDKAQILFESVKEQDPGYVGVYYQLGKLYQQQEHYNKALDTFKAGVQIAAEQGNSHTKSELIEAIEQLKFETEEDSL